MPLVLRFVPVALAVWALASPAAAESLSLSSAAGGSSASSASSASLETSSDSSSKAGGVAEGPYRVLDVAELTGQPGLVRLTLQALEGAGGRVAFTLPVQAVRRAGLVAGDTVLARDRPYGTEFAHAGTREAFFLVVADDWMRELPSRPVVL